MVFVWIFVYCAVVVVAWRRSKKKLSKLPYLPNRLLFLIAGPMAYLAGSGLLAGVFNAIFTYSYEFLNTDNRVVVDANGKRVS